MAYPFLIDFMTAMLMVAGGLTMSAAMLLQNMLFSLAMVGILYRWAMKLTRDRLATVLTVVLILLNGGVGWVMLVSEFQSAGNEGWRALLMNLPHNYTVLWGRRLGGYLTLRQFTDHTVFAAAQLSARTADLHHRLDYLVAAFPRRCRSTRAQHPARDQSTHEPRSNRRHLASMTAAGAIAGLLPLAHAHSFLVLMGMGSCSRC
ncbi:MAG: hypothetical protein WKF84_20100 [Pyrinomonadaceae bacterium]